MRQIVCLLELWGTTAVGLTATVSTPTLLDTTAQLLPAAQEAPLQKAEWCWLLCLISRIQATRRAKNIPINHSFSTQDLMMVPQGYYTAANRKM